MFVFQGRDMFHEHVKEYKLAFSDNDSNYQVYQENGKDRVSFVTAFVWYLFTRYPWNFLVAFRCSGHTETFRRISVQKLKRQNREEAKFLAATAEVVWKP